MWKARSNICCASHLCEKCLINITASNPRAPHSPSLFTIQYIAQGKVEWLDRDTHCYAHLLRTAQPPTLALLAVHATLKDLYAHCNSCLPLAALEELTAYLLSWAAFCSLFPVLTPNKLQDSEYNVARLFHLQLLNKNTFRGFGLRLRSVTLYPLLQPSFFLSPSGHAGETHFSESAEAHPTCENHTGD